MAASRSERDHRYNTSLKGKLRRRRYDQQWRVRDARRKRNLEQQAAKVLDALDLVRKELAQLERIRIGDR